MKKKEKIPTKEKEKISIKEKEKISMKEKEKISMKEIIKAKIARVFHSAIFSSALLLLTILFAGMSSYVYFFSERAVPHVEQGSLDTIVERVGAIMVLPVDEEPTLATVSDPEKLKAQPFFTKAQTGDHVLIYAKAGKAVLYRSSTNQIIEVGPINTGN